MSLFLNCGVFVSVELSKVLNPILDLSKMLNMLSLRWIAVQSLIQGSLCSRGWVAVPGAEVQSRVHWL